MSGQLGEMIVRVKRGKSTFFVACQYVYSPSPFPPPFILVRVPFSLPDISS